MAMQSDLERYNQKAGHSAEIQAVLFDLDGTLADTAPDLAWTLNTLLTEHHRNPLPFDRIRPVVSHGASALIQLGFESGTDDPQFAGLRQRFLEIYHDNLANETRLFPGMAALLDDIEQRGMKWGVVTNKPAWLTEPLMLELKLQPRAACIISGDSTRNRKPHPEPMLHACRHINIPAKHCLYVGDAKRDIEAGHHAGMKALIALFGYIGDSDQPWLWQADGMVNRPQEILDWIIDYNKTAARLE